MSLLPPSTNDAYHGASVAAWFTALLGIAWLVPGMIHSFMPDGGAGSIAGIEMSHQPQLILAMFAWAGATQIAQGLMLLLIALRYRTLVPIALLLCLFERALLSWSGWVRHVPLDGHHPPEHYGSLIALPLILLFLCLSLRPWNAR